MEDGKDTFSSKGTGQDTQKSSAHSKQEWRPGNMLYPLPAVLVSCGSPDGKINVMTAAWTGTVCSDPPMLYVSVKKERFSHSILKETGEFYINLTTRPLSKAVDWCGVKSGRSLDKFREMGLTPVMGCLAYAPMIAESPVCIACRVTQILELGSHDMFLAKVDAVYVDEAYMDERGSFDLSKADPIVYSHGQYYALGEHLGRFGFSVQKKKGGKPRKKKPGKN